MALARRGTPLLILFIALAATVLADTAAAEPVPLAALLEETGARLQWEPYRKLGLLVKGDDYLLFRPDQEWILLNYTIRKKVEPILRKEGNLLFPEATAKEIRSFLGLRLHGAEVPRITTIFIDPGHGGRDTGAVATHLIDGKTVRLVEKDIVLDVSREIGRLLNERYPEKTVRLTRETDTYPSLEDRVEMANAVETGEREAIIYVSVHANASPFNRKADGYEVWYLPPEYRRDLVDSATLEGRSEDIIPILNTMLEEEYTIKSILLARNLLAGLDEQIGTESPNRGLKEQSWYVVRNAKMPSVLVEIGFVTNEKEAALLADQEYLRKIARGIYNGIVSFIDYFEQAEFVSE